jgi:3-oxoacyl-[acyl-carrier protein] reductase
VESDQKIAVIAGGAGGIGTAVVLRLVQDNYFPVVLDRNDKALTDLEEKLHKQGSKGYFIALDLTRSDAVQSAFSQVQKNCGRVDVLANIAGGVIYPKLLQDFTLAEWQEVINVNLKSAFLTCRAVVGTMKQQRSGAIVNTSSNLGFTGGITRTAYSAAKAGVVAFTKSLALALGPYGIRANVIVPGLTATERVMGDFTPERWAQANRAIPMGRTALPTETAEGVAFLASNASQRMTGQNLHVNGGMIMV